jgi:signal transduction histidine kinase
VSPDRPSEHASAPRPRLPEPPAARKKSARVILFPHSRLVGFFVAIVLLGVLTGILRLRSLGEHPSARDVEWILASTVVLTTLVAFTGVFIHRLRLQPMLWRDTERYLFVIRRESEKYRALMEGAADILLIVDPKNGSVREWNLRAREELGLPAMPEGPLDVASIVLAEDLPRFRKALEDAAAGQGPGAPLAEIHLRGNGGRTLVADGRVAAIALDDEHIVQVALRDLTREKEMERQLRIHERLSSVGLLTAGVAHEINNPLEGIGNYLMLFEREDADPEARKRHLEQVRHGFGRIREIVRDLLRFARPASGQGDANLAKVVDDARKLAAYSKPLRGVEIVVEGLDRPVFVVGDAGRLEQVIFNLLLNAATAMRSKGRIRIAARRTEDARGSPELELAVEDEGPGIPPENLGRIFDPFFTTTQGTGLGLSVSYGIVQAHGGTLAAENRPGGGARFTIRLPLRSSAEPSLTSP